MHHYHMDSQADTAAQPWSLVASAVSQLVGDKEPLVP